MEPIKEVTLERVYDATPETLWRSWTDAEILKQWWGPRAVYIREAQIDPRVGGEIRIVMEADESMGEYKGTQWPMSGVFTKVEPESKLFYKALAWTEGRREETTIDQVTEVTFSPEGEGKTKVHIRAAIYKSGPDAQIAIQGMEYGFNQQMDKLGEFLSKE
jgi:uncharacterized protein YndB with AHSA1/START domain